MSTRVLFYLPKFELQVAGFKSLLHTPPNFFFQISSQVSTVSNITAIYKMSELLGRPRSELTEVELVKLEEYEFSHGPLSVLQTAVQNHSQVLISLRNNKKLLARVKAFDRHSNMVLENVKEVGSNRTKK